MENNKYNKFYSKKSESELIGQLRSHRITGNSIDEEWYEALKIHLAERELSDEARNMLDHILSSDPTTLKNETQTGQILNETEKLSKQLSFTEKYPALRTLSGVIAFIGWTVAILTLIIVITLLNNSSGAGSWILPVGVLGLGVILFIALLAYSEIIIVFVDIEENTRKAAAAK
ncbi:MAG TPA: hypothetical protein VF008_01990 [Niastella sp.]